MQSEHIHGFRTFFQLLLIRSGDIQVQPGPVKFPCDICARPVARNHRTLQCDRCDFWCHIKCVDIPLSQYNNLIGSAVNWMCPPCGTIQFSDTVFNNNDSLIELSNSYSSVSSSDQDNSIGEVTVSLAKQTISKTENTNIESHEYKLQQLDIRKTTSSSLKSLTKP